MNNEEVSVVYRTDQKYLYFLKNSIHSLVKYYNDPRELVIYITTNDNIVEIPEIDLLRKKYNFKYKIVRINEEFFEKHPALKEYKSLANRKFLGFRNEFHYTKNNIFNDTTRPYNPFAKSKTTQLASGLFALSFKGKKLLSIDTDTLIVENIAKLFDYNIVDFYCGACRDWVDYNTFSPSVFLCNIEKWNDIFFHENGPFNILKKTSSNSDFAAESFGDQIQHSINNAVGDKWLEIDNTWNVPITHIYQYNQPKIYHFSESWSGRHNVLNTYEKVFKKYVEDDT